MQNIPYAQEHYLSAIKEVQFVQKIMIKLPVDAAFNSVLQPSGIGWFPFQAARVKSIHHHISEDSEAQHTRKLVDVQCDPGFFSPMSGVSLGAVVARCL